MKSKGIKLLEELEFLRNDFECTGERSTWLRLIETRKELKDYIIGLEESAK